MNMETMTKEQLTEYLGTTLDIDSEEFWSDESTQVFYQDSELSAVKDLTDFVTDEFPGNNFEFIHLLDEEHDSYLALWI